MKFDLLTPSLNGKNCLLLSLLRGNLDLYNFILMIIKIVDDIEIESNDKTFFKFIKTTDSNSLFLKNINLIRDEEKEIEVIIPRIQQSLLDVQVEVQVEVEEVSSFSLDLEGVVLLASVKTSDPPLTIKDGNGNRNESENENKSENKNEIENKSENESKNENKSENENIIWTDEDIEKVFQLIANGNIKHFAELIQMNYDIHLTLKDGITSGMLAAKEGQREILNMILNRNIDVSLKDKNKMNIFHYAAMSTDDHMVTYLLSHKKFQKCKNAENLFDLQKCLHILFYFLSLSLSHSLTLSLTISLSLSIFTTRPFPAIPIDKLDSSMLASQDSNGSTPIHIAAMNGVSLPLYLPQSPDSVTREPKGIQLALGMKDKQGEATFSRFCFHCFC